MTADIRSNGENMPRQQVAPMTHEQKTQILSKDIKDITSIESTFVLVQGNAQDKKEFINKIDVALNDKTLDPQKVESLKSWKMQLELLSLPKREQQEQIAGTSDALANNITENILGDTYAALNDSKLLDNIPDNEDGLRQFRNIFKTLDTLLLSGIQDDKLTKKDLKNAGYTKQGLMLDDEEFKGIKDVLKSAQSLGAPGRALISRLADGSNDPELIASLKVQDGKKTGMSRMKSIFSPNIRGNGAITKLAHKLQSTNDNKDTNTVLSDLSGDNGKDLSRDLKNYVTEGQLHDAILMSGLDTKKIFKNVTGSELSGNNVADQEMFKRALEEKITLIKSLTHDGMDSGLIPILNGQADKYGEELLAKLPKDKKVTLKNDSSTWTMVKNGLAMGGSIVIAGVTKGEVIIHGSETNFDKKFQEKSDIDKTHWDKFKEGATKVLTTLHIDDVAGVVGDLITGEIGTIKIDDDKLTESMLANFKARMEKYKAVDKDNYKTQDSPEIKMLLKVNPSATYIEVRNALISNALFQAVQQNTGVDHSFRIGPLFTGYHRESVRQEFTAGSVNGKAAEVEREMTKGDLTAEQIKDLKITAKKEGDNFVYTIPKEISFGKLDHILVTVKDGKTSFSKPQTIALEIDNTHNATTAKIIFTESKDAAPATTEAKEKSLITSLDKIDDIRNTIQGKLLDRSSTKIRTTYKDLQKSILDATKTGDEQQLGAALAAVTKAFGITIDTKQFSKDYQIAALNMVLGELAGDGRLRVIRLIQQDGKTIPPEQLKEGSDLWRAITTMTNRKTGLLYTSPQFRTLAGEKPPTKLLELVKSVTMQTAHQMLDASAKALEKQNGTNKSNEQYTQTQMESLGVNWGKLQTVRKQYRDADNEKVFESTPKYANALGFMVNHQVIVNKNGQIQQTTFEGLSGIGPEDQIRTGVPQKLDEGDVDKNTFIDKLTPSQIERLQPAFKREFGDQADVRELLKNNKDLQVSFSYAEYPNCTNACILMNIGYKNPETGLVISMTASHASEIASVRNMGTKLGAGGNAVAHELNKKDSTPTEEPKTDQKPAEQTTQPRAIEVPEPPITTTPTTTVSNISNGVGAPVVAPAGNTLVSIGVNSASSAVETASQVATSAANNTTSILVGDLPPGFVGP